MRYFDVQAQNFVKNYPSVSKLSTVVFNNIPDINNKSGR